MIENKNESAFTHEKSRKRKTTRSDGYNKIENKNRI